MAAAGMGVVDHPDVARAPVASGSGQDGRGRGPGMAPRWGYAQPGPPAALRRRTPRSWKSSRSLMLAEKAARRRLAPMPSATDIRRWASTWASRSGPRRARVSQVGAGRGTRIRGAGIAAVGRGRGAARGRARAGRGGGHRATGSARAVAVAGEPGLSPTVVKLLVAVAATAPGGGVAAGASPPGEAAAEPPGSRRTHRTWVRIGAARRVGDESCREACGCRDAHRRRPEADEGRRGRGGHRSGRTAEAAAVRSVTVRGILRHRLPVVARSRAAGRSCPAPADRTRCPGCNGRAGR